MASFFSSVQRITSTFCAFMQLMHIYQLLPYVLSTSFSTHPKRPPFYIFRHYATYRKLRKKIQKKIGIFFSIFSYLRAFVVSSCRKSGFRVFLSLRYGADLGRSRLVFNTIRIFDVISEVNCVSVKGRFKNTALYPNF